MSVFRVAWAVQMRRFQKKGRRVLSYKDWMVWLGAGCPKYWEDK